MGGVIALLVFEIWFDWLPPYPTLTIGAQKGCSVFSFAILYLLARAIKLYGISNWFKKNSTIIYVVASVLFAVMARGLVQTGHVDKVMSWLCAYNNPIVIISSIAFLVMFEKLKFQSRFINHLAKSTLAVLLGHTAIFFLYTKQFRYLYDNFTGMNVLGLWVLSIIVVFIASVLIDQLRLILWKPINNYLKTHIKNDNIF